jgi:hypothetical protein
MALRAVPDHPKFADLKARLGAGKAVTLGYLEAMWHFFGKYSDRAIESWVEWDGEPSELVRAMTDSRWLDRDPVHRLIVHDWREHADKATKQTLKRLNLNFVSTVYTHEELMKSESGTPYTHDAQIEHTVHTVGSDPASCALTPENNFKLRALPVPVPVPESGPVPEPVPEPVPARGVRATPHYDQMFSELWEAYPAKGRTKIEDAKRWYLDAVIADPENMHSAIMASILPGGKWHRSAAWAKGFVCSISEFCRNRRWIEDPEPAKAPERELTWMERVAAGLPE